MVKTETITVLVYIGNILALTFGALLFTGGVIMLKALPPFGALAISVTVYSSTTGIYGLFVTYKLQKKLLIGYLAIVTTLIIFLLIFGSFAVAWASSKGKLEKNIDNKFQDHWNNPENERKKKVVMDLQKYFECCGVKGPQQWIKKNMTIPEICKMKNGTYKKGCVREITDISHMLIGQVIWHLFLYASITAALMVSLHVTD